MEWQPGYKVIRLISRRSAVVERDQTRAQPSRASVFYGRHMAAVPSVDCGPLCVFTTLRAAEHFARLSDGLLVVPCAWMPASHDYVWYPWLRTRLSLLPKDTALAQAVFCFE